MDSVLPSSSMESNGVIFRISFGSRSVPSVELAVLDSFAAAEFRL